MPNRTTAFSELVSERLIEIGAGRPRTVNMNGRDLPILRVADVLDGRVEYGFQARTSNRDVQGQESKVSRPGDIVLTTKGTVGRVALMPPDGPAFAYSPQLCYFRPTASGPLRSRFLYYWFKSAEFWVQANALKGQTDMADFLSLGDLQRLQISIPSLDRQDAVVGVLGALDDKIAVNDRIAATAEQLCLAYFSDQTGAAMVSVAELCHVEKKQIDPRELSNTSVLHFSIPSFDAGRTPEVADPREIKSSKFEVPPSAVLVSKLNPGTPRVWQVRHDGGMPAMASTEFLILLPIEGVSTAELWAVLSQPTFMASIAAKVTGTSNSHQRVRPAEIMDAEIADPRQFGQLRLMAEALLQRVHAARQEATTLRALRDTLLPELMSGRLRVTDVEKVVEEAV
ncbi:restriction endonuclease subunit S [Micromonospora sp. NPDC005707]|uniref:restriction endonuclease subunit S n=1 Tax=Micromonospora sp. NPDC005707 TaxID=3157050 RepID=UPI0034028A36